MNAAYVVLYYNKIRLTQTCIQSLLDSGCPAEDIYCFDNGSQGGGGQEIQTMFPQCKHHRTEENRGFSGGFNRGLEWVFASGIESALFCTNDTVVKTGALAACVKTAMQTGAGLVAPLVTYLSNEDNIDSIGAFFNPATGTLHHYHEWNLPVLLDCEKDYIPGTAVWIDRHTFTRLGGVDESFHMYWEDVYLCFRAHRLSIPQARCYEAQLQHGGGQTCRKKPLYTTFYFQRNRIRFCRRYLEGEAYSRVAAILRQELEASQTQWQEKNDTRRLEYYAQLIEELS